MNPACCSINSAMLTRAIPIGDRHDFEGSGVHPETVGNSESCRLRYAVSSGSIVAWSRSARINEPTPILGSHLMICQMKNTPMAMLPSETTAMSQRSREAHPLSL